MAGIEIFTYVVGVAGGGLPPGKMWIARTCSVDETTFIILDKSSFNFQLLLERKWDMVNLLTSLRNSKNKELMRKLESPDDDDLGIDVPPMPCAKKCKKLLFDSITDVVEVEVTGAAVKHPVKVMTSWCDNARLAIELTPQNLELLSWPPDATVKLFDTGYPDVHWKPSASQLYCRYKDLGRWHLKVKTVKQGDKTMKEWHDAILLQQT